MSDTLPLPGNSTATDPKDLGEGDHGTWSLWMGRDRIAAKAEGDWRKRARKVNARFRDDRSSIRESTASDNVHRFNILWSNVQTLQPVLYARTPKPVVQRRFLDKDPVGRLASLLMERALSFSLENHDFDGMMNGVVQDRLLPGRGSSRVMYVPTYGDAIAEDASVDAADAVAAGPGDAEPNEPQQGAATPSEPLGQPVAPASPQTGPTAPQNGSGGAAAPLREVVYEEVVSKYVYWEDYREAPARTWEEVQWVRFRVYMTRAELKARFGAAKAMKVNLDYTPPGSTGAKGDSSEPPADIFKQAVVYEFWDKATRRVIWLAPGTPDLILDEVEDPLGLPGFFPSPDPLLATTTTEKRIPVPDYIEYQDQADELDVLTARIDRLTRALKVAGVYAASEKASLQQLFDDGVENRLIPVEDWAGFAQNKGGLEGTILWLPIKQVAETLIQLCDMRDRSKAIIYEITGIGDIIRGATQPMETATAQKLKASFATRRQVPMQRRVAAYARDVIRIMAAIIAEHFSAETISQITGYPELEPVPDLPPAPAQMIPGPMGMGQAPMPQPQPQQQMAGGMG